MPYLRTKFRKPVSTQIDKKGRREGVIVEVLERGLQQIVGRLFVEDGVVLVKARVRRQRYGDRPSREKRRIEKLPRLGGLFDVRVGVNDFQGFHKILLQRPGRIDPGFALQIVVMNL
jgi:hypothetical protein